MARNKITDLRDHLFETIERLKDDDHPMDLDRAKAIADVARVIVESAKVEVQAMDVMGSLAGTGFIPVESPDRPLRAIAGRRTEVA